MRPSYHQSTLFLGCNATPDPPAAPEMEHKDNFVPPVFLGPGLESFNGLFHRN